MRPLQDMGGFVGVTVNRLVEGRIGKIFSVISRNFQGLDRSAAYPPQNAGCSLMARLVLPVRTEMEEKKCQ
jgi:hypothetical protein